MGEQGEGDRDQAPEGGEPFGRGDVVGITGVAPDYVPVEIDGGGRTERVEFGGLRGQRGRKNHRDKQADHSVRQVVDHEGDEDVVGIVGACPRIGGVQHASGLGANRFAVGLGGDGGGARLRRRRRIAGVLGIEPGVDQLLLLRVDRGKVRRKRAQSGARGVVGLGLPGDFVEEDRRLLKLIEDEDQGAQQQDEELHGDFADRVEHQTQPALTQRSAVE